MTILILCSFLIQATSGYLFGPSEVTGALEGSVTISCYYNTISANIHGRKFWCKMHKSNCDTIISTTSFIAQGHMNRTHLQDFRGNFMINMTSLQHKDAGTYRCGIGINNGGFYYTVIVAVSEGNKIPSSSEIIIATPRDTLNIHCPVQQESYNRSMYRCKTGSTACDTIINSSGYVHKNFWGRVLLEDDTNTTNFKILVNNLKMMDSGLYRCGTGTFKERSEWKDVHVYVINNPDKRRNRVSKTVTESADESLVAQCQVPDNFGPDSLIYWCRWNETGCLRLIDSNGFVQDGFQSRINLKAGNITNMTYTVTMTHLKLEDTGIFWCVITDGQKLYTSSIEVHILVTTTVFYLSAASRGQPSNITTTATTYSDLPPTTETTAGQYSRASSRGQTSSGSSATFSSTPLTTTDNLEYTSAGLPPINGGQGTDTSLRPTRIGELMFLFTQKYSSTAIPPVNSSTEQGTTAEPYSRTSSRGHTSNRSSATISSTPLSTTDSRQDIGRTTNKNHSPGNMGDYTSSSTARHSSAALLPSNTTEQETTVRLYSRASSRGQTSSGSSATISSPLTTADSRQETTAGQCSRASSRGQTSGGSSATFSSTPLTTTSSPEYTSAGLPPIDGGQGSLRPTRIGELMSSLTPKYSSTAFSLVKSNTEQEHTTMLHLRTASRGQTSRASRVTFTTPSPPSITHVQGTTAEPYSRASSRGQTSNRSSATISSTPLSTTDSRQETTVKPYSRASSRGQTSSGSSATISSSPLTTADSRQETTAGQYSRASSRGQTSNGSSATFSSTPLTTTGSPEYTSAGLPPIDGGQEHTTMLHLRTASREQTIRASRVTFTIPSPPSITHVQDIGRTTNKNHSPGNMGDYTSSSTARHSSAALLPSNTTEQETTVRLYSRASSRGQTSSGSSATISSSLTTADSRQETTLGLYSRASSRGQSSNGPTFPAMPLTTTASSEYTSAALPSTNGGQEETTLQNIRTSSRGHTSSRSSATFATFSSTPLFTTDSRQGRDLSGNIIPRTTYRSTTVHNYMVTRFNQRRSQVTNLPGDSTTPIQSIPYKSHYNSQNVSANRLNNLLLIVIPVLLISCIIVITAVVLIVINIRKKRVTSKPDNHEENLAMIDGGAAREGNVEENESTLIRVENQEDISGETEV